MVTKRIKRSYCYGSDTSTYGQEYDSGDQE